MRESRAYLKYFKDNLILLIAGTLLCGLIGFYYQYSRPLIYQSSALIEMNFNEANLRDKISETDELVTQARSVNLRNQFGLKVEENLNIFKPGPLSAQITVSSNNSNTQVSLNSTLDYLNKHFSIHQLGQSIDNQTHANYWLGMLIGAGVGLVVTNLILLTRAYFTNL